MQVMERIRQTTFAEVSEEYAAFVDKFKPKHTTDDCYTPENVYEVIRAWVFRRYNLPADTPVVRPFYPGGDYQAADYPDGCVVIDNPPFSIASQIAQWYATAGIPFFLFGPALTLFNNRGVSNYVIVGAQITYANGAKVPTSFVTSMGENLIETAPDLYDAIKAADDANRKETTKQQAKYSYPPAIVTAAAMNYLCVHHTPFAIKRGDAMFIRKMDAQAGADKALFGGGFLLTERAAAERAAAERAAAERAAAERAAREKAAAHVWELSPRERDIQRLMERQRDAADNRLPDAAGAAEGETTTNTNNEHKENSHE